MEEYIKPITQMETETGQSPKPKDVEVEQGMMEFPEAMINIIRGKKVHKLEWEDKDYYGFLNGEFLSIHKPDGKNYKWIVNKGDLEGDDYIVV